ncbi:hypothetical protein QAD02_000067 [Eretmocerus hayati]|uniref:Uncharacterized protein n=1 Tax=Eretmocerus hayati TaxID=131215 RepID=A0ACC2NDF4_9HYME|nr:hypothetical protein QAD02_000067 [Eretmocerus hayati]
MSTLEQGILFNHIRAHEDTVESTATNASTKMAKKNAWIDIAARFARSCRAMGFTCKVQRSPEQLQTFWKNTKAKVRKVDSELKQDKLATGGGAGVPEDSGTDHLCDQVKSIVPMINFTLENEWDSTSNFERENTDNEQHASDDEMSSVKDEEDTDVIFTVVNLLTIPLLLHNKYLVIFPFTEVINVFKSDEDDNSVKPQRRLKIPLSEDLPLINLTEEDVIDSYDEPKNSQTVYPEVKKYKVLNPLSTDKYRAALPQKNVNQPTIKKSKIPKGRGQVYAKIRRTMKIFKNCCTNEAAVESIESKLLERSPLKSVPQPDATHSYGMDLKPTLTDGVRKIPRKYIPIECKNVPKKKGTNNVRDLGPLQRRLEKCQAENIRPSRKSQIPIHKTLQRAPEAIINLTNDDIEEQNRYKAEIFREKMAATQYEKSYWINKSDTSAAEKETQLIMKEAAPMKLEYYRRKCASQGTQEDPSVERNQAGEQIPAFEEVLEGSNVQPKEE